MAKTSMVNREVKRKKLAIPHDLAVVGVVDYENSLYFDPPLSSVGVHRHQVGRDASQLLLSMLSAPNSAKSLRFEAPVEIVLRESTCLLYTSDAADE